MVGRRGGAARVGGAGGPREAAGAWFYKQRIGLSGADVVEEGCELLGAGVGETLRPAEVTLPVDAAAEQWCDALLAGAAERFALIAPTAGWGAKRWPAERYGAVAAALGRAGFRTLVNAESPEDEAGIRVVEASGGGAALGPWPVGRLLALVRRARVVIAGATRPLHQAAASERPWCG